MSISELIADMETQIETDELNEDTADKMAWIILKTDTFFSEEEKFFILDYYNWAIEKLDHA